MGTKVHNIRIYSNKIQNTQNLKNKNAQRYFHKKITMFAQTLKTIIIMKKITVFLFLFITIISCQDESFFESHNFADNPHKSQRVISNNTWHSSKMELDSTYYSNKNLLHYRQARIIAYADLLCGGIELINPEPDSKWELTQYPRIVYNYNNIPEYYEFGLLKNDKIIATISTYTTKKDVGVIAYMIPNFQHDAQTTQYIHYTGNYPHDKYYGTYSQRQPTLYYENGKLNEFIKSPTFKTEEENLQEMINVFANDKENPIDSTKIHYAISNYRQAASLFWKRTDSIFNKWLNTSYIESHMQFLEDNDEGSTEVTFKNDSEIANIIAANMGTIDSKDLHEIPAYKSDRIRCTYWRGYCGPAALAFIYRGIYKYFPLTSSENYLPILGDIEDNSYFIQKSLYAFYNFDIDNSQYSTFNSLKEAHINRSNLSDYGLSALFYKECTWFYNIFKGYYELPLYELGMRKGIKNATNNKYSLTFTTEPYKDIESNNPVIIAINCNHYIIGIACAKNSNGKKYELVTDNGNKISEQNYAPYWHRQNFWNLHYKVFKQ